MGSTMYDIPEAVLDTAASPPEKPDQADSVVFESPRALAEALRKTERDHRHMLHDDGDWAEWYANHIFTGGAGGEWGAAAQDTHDPDVNGVNLSEGEELGSAWGPSSPRGQNWVDDPMWKVGLDIGSAFAMKTLLRTKTHIEAREAAEKLVRSIFDAPDRSWLQRPTQRGFFTGVLGQYTNTDIFPEWGNAGPPPRPAFIHDAINLLTPAELQLAEV